MKNCGGCGSWIPDDAVSCPSCGRGQGAGDPPESPAPPSAEAPLPVEGGAPEPGPDPGGDARLAFVLERARTRIRTLGSLYIVYGLLSILWVAWAVFQYASGDLMASLEQLREQWPPELRTWLDQFESLYRNPGYLLAAHFLPFALGALTVWNGIQLRGLRGRTTGILVASLQLALSLCASCCCCLSLPLGIWGLVVLTSGEAKAVMDTVPGSISSH